MLILDARLCLRRQSWWVQWHHQLLVPLHHQKEEEIQRHSVGEYSVAIREQVQSEQVNPCACVRFFLNFLWQTFFEGLKRLQRQATTYDESCLPLGGSRRGSQPALSPDVDDVEGRARRDSLSPDSASRGRRDSRAHLSPDRSREREGSPRRRTRLRRQSSSAGRKLNQKLCALQFNLWKSLNSQVHHVHRIRAAVAHQGKNMNLASICPLIHLWII